MEFDLTGFPKDSLRTTTEIGDCFAARGGRGEAALWLVASINGNSAHCLGIDSDGKIVSTATYNMTALEGRGRIAACTNMKELKLSVMYIDKLGCR